MALVGQVGRSVRSRRSRTWMACLPVVEALGQGGDCPERNVERVTRCIRGQRCIRGNPSICGLRYCDACSSPHPLAVRRFPEGGIYTIEGAPCDAGLWRLRCCRFRRRPGSRLADRPIRPGRRPRGMPGLVGDLARGEKPDAQQPHDQRNSEPGEDHADPDPEAPLKRSIVARRLVMNVNDSGRISRNALHVAGGLGESIEITHMRPLTSICASSVEHQRDRVVGRLDLAKDHRLGQRILSE